MNETRLQPRPAILETLKVFLTYRALLFAATFLMLSMMPDRVNIVEKNISAFPEYPFIDGFFRWDSGWYDRIVREGYQSVGAQNTTAFFPLYPLLVWLFGHAIGNQYIAGILVSNVAAVLGLVFVYRLTQEVSWGTNQSGVAKRATILILVYPASFFLSVYYSEGLYLGLTAWSLWAYHRGALWQCGWAGFLSTLTRPTGVMLFGALALAEAWRWTFERKKPGAATLWLLAIPLGLVPFMVWLWWETGDMWAFSRAQAGWGRQTTFPLFTLWNEFRSINWGFPKSLDYGVDAMKLLDLGSAVVLLVSGLLMLRTRLPKEFGLYVVLSVLMALSTGRVLSMLRFGSVLFPVFIYWSQKLEGHAGRERLVVYMSSMLLLFLQLRFMTWHWAG